MTEAMHESMRNDHEIELRGKKNSGNIDKWRKNKMIDEGFARKCSEMTEMESMNLKCEVSRPFIQCNL